MHRKIINIKIGEKEFTFSERNKEDVDFNALQDKLRAQKFKFIQENVKDAETQIALLSMEMKKVYSAQEIGVFFFSNREEKLKMIFDSFKIANPDVKFEDLKKIIPDADVDRITKIINELESEEVTDKKKAAESD